MNSICHRSCEKCNLRHHCRGCSFCEAAVCKKDCHQCFSLCPKRGGSFAYLKKVGGGKVELLENERYELPVHIPIFPDRLKDEVNVEGVVAVHSGSFLTKDGSDVIKRYKTKGISESLNLKKAEFVLEFYIKDRQLEGFWDNRHALYEKLKGYKWKAIIAPNFSVYEDAPRMDHLYNMKRTSIVYNDLRRVGLPVIPDISWYNRIDLDQWVREINENGLKTIAFSFQVVNVRLKASNLWKHYLLGFKYLCQRLNDDVQIVIAGVVSPDRLKVIKKAAGAKRIIVLNQTAYLHSRKGFFSENAEKAPAELTREDILLKNLAYYEEEYAKLNEGGGLDA